MCTFLLVCSTFRLVKDLFLCLPKIENIFNINTELNVLIISDCKHPLYESRYEAINESKVVMETMRLIPFFNRFNALLARMNAAHIKYMFENLSTKDKIAVLTNPELLK